MTNIIQPSPYIFYSNPYPCILYSSLFPFSPKIIQPALYILYSFIPISSNLLTISSTLLSQYHLTCSRYPLLFYPNIIQPSPYILYSVLPISYNLLSISSTLSSQYHPIYAKEIGMISDQNIRKRDGTEGKIWAE